MRVLFFIYLLLSFSQNITTRLEGGWGGGMVGQQLKFGGSRKWEMSSGTKSPWQFSTTSEPNQGKRKE